MAAFSRVQLAAALLEYDNEPNNPDAPNRFAYESAVFLPLRQNAGNKPWISRKNEHSNLPLDAATTAKSVRSNSALDNRQSRASISTLQNPFGPDEPEDVNDNNEEDLEVDLASWGLDAFIPKDKSSKNGKGKAKSNDLPPSHPVSQVTSHHPLTNHDTPKTSPKRALGASRSMSVGGNLEYFGDEIRMKRPPLMDDSRRRSISSPLDTFGMDQPEIVQRRRASSYTTFPTPAMSSIPPHSVPFPTSATSVRSVSPNINEDTLHRRSQSTVSMDLNVFTGDVEQNSDRKRVLSNATMATLLLSEDNPFALRPPSRASRFDPKAVAHARSISNASLGSRVLLENDDASLHISQAPDSHERRYSTTMDLLRPKVLIMPSPLQLSAPLAPPSKELIREGFHLTTDGPPLPPGARSSRRLSAAFSALEAPLTSTSLTPNPNADLSLSQKTFRNTLWTADQHATYMDDGLPRATVDGEQAHIDTEMDDLPVVSAAGAEEPARMSRPAGKLFGKSLIDDLEERKAQMRSKQRVFYGDERPSMMARTSNQQGSTFIDSAAFQSRPDYQRMSSFGSQGSQQALGRRSSANVRPLLNFDEDDKVGVGKTSGSRIPHGRSVFGVDTLWEREMSKLKEIEAQEKREEEERRLREEAEDAKKRKKKRKSKGKSKVASDPEPKSFVSGAITEPRVSVEPPLLPDIPRAGRRPPPRVTDDDSESDESVAAGTSHQNNQPPDPSWHAVSSDEDAPVRTTGTGPRYPVKHRHNKDGHSSDSEEDVPLSVAISRVAQKHALPPPESDDERPLSNLLRNKQSSRSNTNLDSLLPRIKGNEDEDNEPLGLRASRLAPSLHTRSRDGDDDDDRPLALNSEQQRRSQFNMMARQQQQYMMQAQMQNSMYFSPSSMIGSPFFNPALMPIMSQVPIPVPSPPPVHDQAKYNRVDNWRRGVTVEGEP